MRLLTFDDSLFELLRFFIAFILGIPPYVPFHYGI